MLADLDRLRRDDAPPPQHGFTTTGDPEVFRRLALRFLGLGSDVGHVFTSPVDLSSLAAPHGVVA